MDKQREAKAKPLFRDSFLIVVGGLLIMVVTLFGVLNNPDELIRNDVRLGPVIAASRIVIPLFATIGIIVFLGRIKKCEACGKLLFWKKD